jgi:DNA-binding transcriptional regulator YdaS (Cro superfamily)
MTPTPDLPGVDKLLDYIAANHASQSEFAKLAGFSPSQFSQMISGHRKVVNLTIAARIEIATRGVVTMRDFLPDYLQWAIDVRWAAAKQSSEIAHVAKKALDVRRQ